MKQKKIGFFFEILFFAQKHLTMVWVNFPCRKDTEKRVLRVITAHLPYSATVERSSSYSFLMIRRQVFECYQSFKYSVGAEMSARMSSLLMRES